MWNLVNGTIIFYHWKRRTLYWTVNQPSHSFSFTESSFVMNAGSSVRCYLFDQTYTKTHVYISFFKDIGRESGRQKGWTRYEISLVAHPFLLWKGKESRQLLLLLKPQMRHNWWLFSKCSLCLLFWTDVASTQFYRQHHHNQNCCEVLVHSKSLFLLHYHYDAWT